jgi:hypothetical protein
MFSIQYSYSPQITASVWVRVCPYDLCLTSFQRTKCCRPYDPHIVPSLCHHVVILSASCDMRVETIILFQWVGEAGGANDERECEHADTNSLENLHFGSERLVNLYTMRGMIWDKVLITSILILNPDEAYSRNSYNR